MPAILFSFMTNFAHIQSIVDLVVKTPNPCTLSTVATSTSIIPSGAGWLGDTRCSVPALSGGIGTVELPP